MGTRRSFLHGAVVLPILTVIGAGGARAETRVLKGTVFYRERIALPPGAVVTVQLNDVSRADAPSVTIAETQMIAEHAVPIPYELGYDDAVILDNHSYSLSARIESGGRLLFVSTQRVSVLTGQGEATDILVERVARKVVPPTGRWLAEDILGGGVLDRVQTVLDIGEDGRVGGSSGCNAITGEAEIKGDRITFGPIAATRRACVPALGDQEQKFFKALGLARRWRYDAGTGKLTLSGRGGVAVMVLARHD